MDQNFTLLLDMTGHLQEELSFIYIRFDDALDEENIFSDEDEPASSSISSSLDLRLPYKGPITIRMHKERNHLRPHVHVEFPNGDYSASYCIYTTRRLAGHRSRKFEISIQAWILINQSHLINIWNSLQDGDKNPHGLTLSLSGYG